MPKGNEMAFEVIKYRLTKEGTIPEFLYLGEDGVGGAYVHPDPTASSPQDMVMIGIANNGANGSFEVIPSKAALLYYLQSISAGWTQINPADPESDPIPFDPAAAADYVWARKDALNA
jgi:hypothetical protein